MPAMVTSAVMVASAARDAAAVAADVVVVHRLGQHEVGVGVEAADELVAVVVDVRLDRVAAADEGLLALLVVASEARRQLELGAVADVADAARDRQALVRPVAGLGVVVVAAAPLRVGADRRASARGTARSPPRSPARPTEITTARCDALALADGPLEHAHATHRPTDDRVPAVDAERVGERNLQRDLVADRRDREPRPVGPPVRGVSDDGPVVPWQPPSTLGHTTKNRSVSIGAARVR